MKTFDFNTGSGAISSTLSPYNGGFSTLSPPGAGKPTNQEQQKQELEKQLQQLQLQQQFVQQQQLLVQQQQQLVQQQISHIDEQKVASPPKRLMRRTSSSYVPPLMLPIQESDEDEEIVEMTKEQDTKQDIFFPNEDQQQQQLLGMQFNHSPPLVGRTHNRSKTLGEFHSFDLSTGASKGGMYYEQLPSDGVIPPNTDTLEAWSKELQRVQALDASVSPHVQNARLVHLHNIIPGSRESSPDVSRGNSPNSSTGNSPNGSRGNSPPSTPRTKKHRRSQSVYAPSSGLSKKAQKAMATREKNRLKLQEAFKHTLKDEVVTKPLKVKALHTRRSSAPEFPELHEPSAIAMQATY